MNNQKFVPGKTRINYGGRIYDKNEVNNLIAAAKEFWLTNGRFESQFILKLINFLGINYVISTNSGTSANLLAITSLTSKKWAVPLKRGDEVITTATCFPTTVAPIIQNNLVPVFVDVNLGTYNVDPKSIENAITKKTKAAFLTHTMGNPFEVEKIKKICVDHGLYLIEDNCDALGAKYKGQYTGTFGDLGTLSFYPPHHITTGEGGAILTNNIYFKMIIQSLRDWGRDCYCETGIDNTCMKRFDSKFGDLPYGYDHKYVYSHLGYSMRMTDMQASIGVAQMDKLEFFIKRRRENFEKLYKIFKKYEQAFILPEITKDSEPSPFGFTITIKDNQPFRRKDIVEFFEKNLIQTRMLFAGNIIKQPCMEGIKYKVSGTLENSDKIMNDTFWIGVYPGITDKMINYIKDKLDEFFEVNLFE
jgi:CDP-6-deoxy-D-xylo-4-hexulose-3-dehydrase